MSNIVAIITYVGSNNIIMVRSNYVFVILKLVLIRTSIKIKRILRNRYLPRLL